ncbi:MAG: DUF4160 domain-containing protein [Actinomycetota bacterium]|nr:DUF4160 domain-containing protein [Actinomycetota bacterium]
MATLEVIAGGLPNRAMRLVREWGELHRAELSWPRRGSWHSPTSRWVPLSRCHDRSDPRRDCGRGPPRFRGGSYLR